MDRVFLTNTKGVEFEFIQNKDSFIVKENSNIKLSKKGDFRLIEVTKKDISTMELVQYLSEVLKINPKDIGYAGLKDKYATAIQFITLPKYANIKKFKNSSRVTLKELGFVKDRLRVGKLDSNSFIITLNSVSKENYSFLEDAFNKIIKYGFANFFGYQRFGSLEENQKKAKKISLYGKGTKNQNSKILLASYQAKFFNDWLNRRLEISKNILEDKDDKILKQISPTLIKEIKSTNSLFKLLPGDLGYFYKKGKKSFSITNDIKKYTNSFMEKRYHITGVLFGSNIRLSASIAGKIEREFIDYSFDALRGARRDAWVFVKSAKIEFDELNSKAKLFFTLPPGSYATVLLEELLNRTFK